MLSLLCMIIHIDEHTAWLVWWYWHIIISHCNWFRGMITTDRVVKTVLSQATLLNISTVSSARRHVHRMLTLECHLYCSYLGKAG